MIGIFDSGIGGLSVLAALAGAMPRADLVYLADSANLPYGSKSSAFIEKRVLALGEHLSARGCRLLVVACNTATVAAVHALRARLPHLPVVGVEPGVKPAAASSRSRQIAVLATESTAASARLQALIAQHAQGVEVHIEPCPGWATYVETLNLAAPGLHDEIGQRIRALLARGVDRLVLGCTHYSFLAPLIAPHLSGKAELVDVAVAVARQCERLAGTQDSKMAGGSGRLSLYATAQPERLNRAIERLRLDQLQQRLHGAAELLTI